MVELISSTFLEYNPCENDLFQWRPGNLKVSYCAIKDAGIQRAGISNKSPAEKQKRTIRAKETRN